MVKRAALILAGGKARRFQTKGQEWHDKALAELAGKPLLIHAVENVQGVVDEVVVCVNDEGRKTDYLETLRKNGLSAVKVVVDEKISHISGPNVAIMTGLSAVKADYCLTLPCDMPFLHSSVADCLFSEAEDYQVAVPMWPNGRLETLVMVLERHSALEITRTLCLLKRPRSDDIPRGAAKTLLISPVDELKKLDPELKSFININSKQDLTQLQTRKAHGPITENLKIILGEFSVSGLQLLREGAKKLSEGEFGEAKDTFELCINNFEAKKSYFWMGVAGESLGEAYLMLSKQQVEAKLAVELDFEGKEAYLKAANCYRVEAEMYDENRCRLLAERALADKAWCESWVMGKHSHVHRYPPKVA
jgi:molybdenum cofactor guanylyltransferase